MPGPEKFPAKESKIVVPAELTAQLYGQAHRYGKEVLAEGVLTLSDKKLERKAVLDAKVRKKLLKIIDNGGGINFDARERVAEKLGTKGSVVWDVLHKLIDEGVVTAGSNGENGYKKVPELHGGTEEEKQ